MKKILSFIACATITATVSTEAHAEKITVNDGDTLWKISQQYGVSVNDIKNWNELETEIIKPKDSLVVSKEKTYKVVNGDSLWTIAKKNNITVDQLIEWNQLQSERIFPGNDLIIKKGKRNKKKANIASKSVKVMKNNNLNDKSKDLKSTVDAEQSSGKELTVTATAYTASCEGCSGITKTGINLKERPNEKVISVDPSVIPLGTKVYVEGYGTAIAGDTGGAIKGNKIDVFVSSNKDALDWGRKKVKVKILD
ncbi:LysM peptidoglycan-binding domain-containing protein [Niallia sp. 01092]|uniref:LysM peptidoglycan-binding domain-containing protein n=1 Tax=unclassified Niallia TaxID=2837522 RepID=UPI003FD1D769